MALTFDQFFANIARQESGGNYRIVNGSSGALGKYQIMPANLPLWSKAALGHSITVAQFLASPALQDKIARTKLLEYWNKYGARGAAAAWYSGKPGRANDYTSVKGGPSVGDYVDQVVGKSAGGGGSGPVAPPTVKNAMDSYAYIGKLAQTIPEIKHWLDIAIQQGWPPDKFTAKIQDTAWWKTHSDSIRQRLIQSVTDPGSYKQDLGEATRRVNQMAVQVGLTLDAKTRDFAAHQLLMSGWNDIDLHNYIGSKGHVGKNYGGEFSQSVSKLEQLMGDYGISASSGLAEHYAKFMVAGNMTIDAFATQFRKQAISRFPALRALLDQGQTVRQIAQPYVDDYSRILELDPAGVSVTDPLLTRALSGRDEKNQPTLMPLWQFQHELKNDPRYDHTNQAKTDAFSLLHKVGQDWGYAS